MAKNNTQHVEFRNRDLVKIHWFAQIIANLFFGLSLALITLSYAGFSGESIKKITLLYLLICCGIFLPFYWVLPVFLFRKARETFNKVKRGEKVSQDEIGNTIESLLGLPLKVSVIIPITVWLGFGLGGYVLYQGIIPEFTPLIHLVVISCMSIGLGVGFMHSFLNYIFLDEYLRPIINFLGLYFMGSLTQIKIKKIPLAAKVFLMVFLVSFTSQVSSWSVLSVHAGLASAQELKSAFLYASVVSGLTLMPVFVIATLFARNITHPLKKLIDWSGEVIEGKSAGDISLITNDEIAYAVEHIKKMVEQLEESRKILEIRVKARTKELRELMDEQEGTIEQRTKELQRKVKELEAFRKVAVGRELKMMELKKALREKGKE